MILKNHLSFNYVPTNELIHFTNVLNDLLILKLGYFICFVQENTSESIPIQKKHIHSSRL